MGLTVWHVASLLHLAQKRMSGLAPHLPHEIVDAVLVRPRNGPRQLLDLVRVLALQPATQQR